jgi:hypothetical protein
MRRPSSRLTAFAACGVVLAVTTACGGSGESVPENPKAALSASVGNLADSDVLTTTLRLDTTPEDLKSFAAKDGDELSDADAAAIAGAEVVLQVQSNNGDKLSELKPGDNDAANVSFRALSNGQTYVELRVVDGDLYLQGDVEGILDLLHQSKAYADVQARVASLPGFVQAFVEGRWVSINGTAAQGLLGSFSGDQTPDEAQGRQLVDDLQGMLERDVTVTRAGSDDRGDHLVLTGNTRELARDFLDVASSAVPGGQAATGQFDPEDAPDRDITVDAWVKDGVLSEISLDLVQFAKPGEVDAGMHLPIAVAFEQDGDDIGEPEDVTPVDLTQLGALLGAVGGM